MKPFLKSAVKYFVTAIFLVIIMIAKSQNQVYALTCMPSTIQEHIESADAIFAGKVIKIQHEIPDTASSATFEVSEYWKGNVNKFITIVGIYAWDGTANPPFSVYFKEGESYLVFSKSVPDAEDAKNIPNNLIASINCGQTRPLSLATDLKVTLGLSKIPGKENDIYFFAKNLSQGMTGEDVRELQKYLNMNGFSVTTSGAGSSGNETVYFGSATRAALTRFQTAHATELGIIQGTGYFGPLTRALINK